MSAEQFVEWLHPLPEVAKLMSDRLLLLIHSSKMSHMEQRQGKAQRNSTKLGYWSIKNIFWYNILFDYYPTQLLLLFSSLTFL